MRDNERIAAALRELGVDARPIDGWIYFTLADNAGVMGISAEYGASLAASHYPLTPTWFVAAPTDREREHPPYEGPPSLFQEFLRDGIGGAGG